MIGCDPVERGGNLVSLSGVSSAVERQLPKLDVAGSIPVPRSIFFKSAAQSSGNSAFTVKNKAHRGVANVALPPCARW